jgi:hypothetical protein
LHYQPIKSPESEESAPYILFEEAKSKNLAKKKVLPIGDFGKQKMLKMMQQEKRKWKIFKLMNRTCMKSVLVASLFVISLSLTPKTRFATEQYLKNIEIKIKEMPFILTVLSKTVFCSKILKVSFEKKHYRNLS